MVRVIPGIILMFAIAFFSRGGSDFNLHQWLGMENYFAANTYTKALFLDVLHFNYILLSIIIGMLIGNIFGVPKWAAEGIKTSRLFIKLGVILLGSLYSIADVAALGGTSVMIILFFILITLFLTINLGRKVGMEPSATLVLAAGTSVCGVSAIVAVAPAVRAKSEDVVYSIATILSFGLVTLFIFPVIGSLANLTPHQFGVWAGTGILNSGQILAVCLAFDPGTTSQTSASLKTGEIYNLTRVIFLPFVVLLLAFIHSKEAPLSEEDINIDTGLWSKFPLFVLGFMLMVLLTSFGLLGQTSPPSSELTMIRKLYNWFFAIGLSGLGMQISFAELRKAGGKPLIVGSVAAIFKVIMALVVVLLFVSPKP